MQGSDDAWIRQAVDDIEEWMVDHDLESFVAKLRPGASDEALAAAEQQLGAALGPSLRTLYRMHDGQDWRLEREPFFEHMFFLDLAEACRLRSIMLKCYFVPPQGLELYEYHRRDSPLSEDELRSEAWFPFANTEGDFLAVHLGTGRVIRAIKGGLPRLELEASSLGVFLGDYATRLWDDQHELLGDPSLPGVGDGLRWLGRYLARR